GWRGMRPVSAAVHPQADPVLRSTGFLLLAALPLLAAASTDADRAPAAPPAIHLNQLGFLPGAGKIAVVEGIPEGRYQVVREDDGGVVLEGTLPAPATWPASGRAAAAADFGTLDRPGRYRLRVQGQVSDPFPVGADAYGALGDAALKGYYFNRAGTALEPEHRSEEHTSELQS